MADEEEVDFGDRWADVPVIDEEDQQTTGTVEVARFDTASPRLST